MPQVPDLHDMRCAASQNKYTKAHEHPIKRQIASFADEVDESDGN